MSETAVREAAGKGDAVVSHSGVALARATTFRFTLDVTAEQHQQLLAHAGASRLAFNHHLARVKANLNQRAAERSYGVADADLTAGLSWSKVAFINEMNTWKDGRAPGAPVGLDEAGNVVRGLAWRGQVSADVFETASVNAAQALKNWSDSRTGARAGKAAGFPRFKSRHRTAPTFRLRSKHTKGRMPPVRPAGVKAVRFPKLGVLRVRESTRLVRRMLQQGRLRIYAAAFRYANLRWTVAITGIAATLHPARRSPAERHQPRVGVDLGVKTLAVVADEDGALRHAWEGVKALQHALARLKLDNQALARSKPGSTGWSKAKRRLGKVHARIAGMRAAYLHHISAQIARGYRSVVIEDLNAAGMLANRRLARVISDAAFGELRRQLVYKCDWHGTELIIASRWFPSSKTCSGCGTVKAALPLADRIYTCAACGLEIDRDINAAINLARYTPPLPAAA